MKRLSIPRELAGTNGWDRRTVAAFHAAVRRYAGKPWVTGVGIGVRERGRTMRPAEGTVIAIHVRRKLVRHRVPKSQRIPRQILGVPTDVVQLQFTRTAPALASIPTPVSLPLRPGSSLGRAVTGSAATLGGIVQDAAGFRYLVTAGHVLREGGSFQKGYPVVHPGPLDVIPGAPGAPLIIARSETIHEGADVGVARLEPQTIAVDNTLSLGTVILAPQLPKTGDILQKKGRTSGTTRSQVLRIGLFGGVYPAALLGPCAGDALPIAAAGDSGAVWYDAQTKAAVAVHIGVDQNSGNNVTIAAVLQTVLTRLKLRWV